jgi:hypothetical protein
MSTTTATESLFDRDAEVALLREALADARDGRGRLVIVEGEPGIGMHPLGANRAYAFLGQLAAGREPSLH